MSPTVWPVGNGGYGAVIVLPDSACVIVAESALTRSHASWWSGLNPRTHTAFAAREDVFDRPDVARPPVPHVVADLKLLDGE